MPDAENNILKSKPGKKSLKYPFIIYADLECLLLKMNTCNSNLNKSYTKAYAKVICKSHMQKHYISPLDTLY